MKTVIEMAREALEHAAWCVQNNYLPDQCGHDWDDVIAALVREDEREKQQEPVAWMWRCKPYCGWPNWAVSIKRQADAGINGYERTKGYEDFPLYATPPTAALAARQMRDAAVKVCRDGMECTTDESIKSAVSMVAYQIAALPVPEVQWLDLTQEEVSEAYHANATLGIEAVVRAVIAKFKEKNK